MRVTLESLSRIVFLYGFCARLALAQEASPLPSPPPPPGLNPFCDVSARAEPWDLASNKPSATAAADALAIQLFSQRPSRLDAHVTLIGDRDAYDAFLPRVALSGEPFTLASQTYVVLLSRSVAIRYVYVDAYAADGKTVSCPSQPSEVLPSQTSLWHPPAPLSFNRSSAVSLGALPAVPCGNVIQEARLVQGAQPRYPLAASSQSSGPVRTSEIHVYLDANGNLVKSFVYRSSGYRFLDDAALIAAQRSRYAPRTFLCIPVVGEYLFRMDFRP